MFTVKPLPGFITWLDDLPDVTLRSVVLARIKRLERGLFGDVEPVGEGVSELRIQVVQVGGFISRGAAIKSSCC